MWSVTPYLNRLNRHATPEHLFSLTGWLLMAAAVSQLVLRGGVFLHLEHLSAATLFAALALVFVLLLRPQLGTHHEASAMISAMLVFVTCLVLFTHILANQGDWQLARAYRWAQQYLAVLLGAAAGEGIAAFSTSPLYIMAALLLLLGFAYRSTGAFILLFVCLMVYGMYPWDIGILTAYLLWFAGFLLIRRDVIYLPLAIQERLSLTGPMRDVLHEVRRRPLAEHEVLFLLAGPVPREEALHSKSVKSDLGRMAQAGLLEYSPESHRVCASDMLAGSYLPGPVRAFVEGVGLLARYLILMMGFLYLAFPADFLPEMLIGPIGYLDDLVVLALTALPVGADIVQRFGQRKNLAPR